MDSIRRVVGSVALSVACLGGSGCSDEATGKPTQPNNALSSSDGEYSIKVLVEQDGKTRLVEIGPADAPVSGGDAIGLSEAAPQLGVAPPGQRPQATVRLPDGTVIDSNEQDALGNRASGETLLAWAANSCIRESETPDKFPHSIYSVRDRQWQDDLYIFPNTELASCDEALYMQQTLVCAADRLAQIGDSVGTLSWKTRVPNTVASEGSFGDLAVTVPPQAVDDRFIARDIALNALAHAGRLQLMTPGTSAWTGTIRTCIDGYASLAVNGVQPSGRQLLENVPGSQTLFSEYYPPHVGDVGLTVAQLKEIGAARLLQQASISIAAQGMLRQLVEASVQDDLAGAEKLKGAAGDPMKGLAAFWGAPGTADSPYNSVRHALKTLFGRLEVGTPPAGHSPDWRPEALTGTSSGEWGRTYHDPRCKRDLDGELELGSGLSALNIMDALGDGFSARWNDVAPATPAQASTVTTMDQAGIILPAFSGLNADSVRTAIVTQLKRDAAARAGVTLATLSTAEADSIKATIDKFTDEDIRFGLDRVFDAFRLVVDAPGLPELEAEDVPDFAADTGLDVKTAPEIAALGGIVLSAPVPRHVLGADVMGRMGLAQRASQCGRDSSPGVVDYVAGQATVLQNVFALGGVMRRHLGVIRDAAESATLPEVTKLAELGLVQSKDWAGGQLVHWTADDVFALALVEFTEEDLGAPLDSEDLAQSLVMVDPNPILADCVAGIRTMACPANPEGIAATEGTVIPKASVFGGAGLNGPVLALGYGTLPAEYSGYLVQKPMGDRVGRVLAFINSISTTSGTKIWERVTLEVVSPEQRRLANAVFGLQPLDRAQRTCASITPTSLPSQYCIPGMQRDMFVPLANEITSSGSGSEDSWRHYLDIAEQAAAKADELGRQIIEVGLQKDLRQEAATEELGQLCGGYPSTVSVDANDGQLAPSTDDAKINECTNPTTVDLVFLRKDPYEGMAAEAAGEKILADFCDNPLNSGNPPFCSKVAAEITHAGLNYSSSLPLPPQQGGAGECKKITDAYDEELFNHLKFLSVAEAGWSTQTGFAGAVAGMRLKEFEDGHWLGYLSHTPRLGTYEGAKRVIFPGVTTLNMQQQANLDSVARDIWPACEGVSGGCSDDAEVLGEAFSAPTSDPKQIAILKEVEGAFFYMGAFAGQVPAGVFEIPLPAANAAVLGDGVTVSAPALYGAGVFTQTSPGKYKLLPTGFLGRKPWQTSESSMVGTGVPVDTSGFAARRTGNEGDWIETLYDRIEATPSGYVLLPTKSAEIGFNQDFPVISVPNARDPNGRSVLGEWFKELSLEVGCTGSFGSGSSEDPDDITCFTSCPTGEISRSLDAAGVHNPRSAEPPNNFLQIGGGRQVCTNAAISSVFTTGKLGFDIHDDPVIGDGLNASTSFYSPVIPEQPAPGAGANGWGAFGLQELIGGERGEKFDYVWGAHNLDSGNASMPCSILVSRSDTLTGPCGQEEWHTPANIYSPGTYRIAHDRLRPNQCSAAERVEMFLQTGITDDCQAMGTIARAMMLSCMTDRSASLRLGPPPIIKSVSDLVRLESWLDLSASVVGATVDAMYLVDVPASVVQAAIAGRADTGAVDQGERGRLLLGVAKNISDLENSISNIESNFRLLQGEVRKARIDVEFAALEADAGELERAFRRLDVERQLAVGAVTKTKQQADKILDIVEGGISGAGTGFALGPWGAAAGAATGVLGGFKKHAGEFFENMVLGPSPLDVDMDFLQKQASNLSAQDANAEKIDKNRLSAALSDLTGNTEGLYQGITNQLSRASDAQATALQNLGALNSNAASAQLELARAAGSDFVETSSGDLLPLPVNTVLRRQLGVLQQRYVRALTGAKRSAYLARLSIEQRLGTRLDDLVESIGPIEAPALWVDDLCSVQGIDYNALRAASSPSTGVGGEGAAADASAQEIDLIRGFSDQYIGDYVSRLREFVEFYNVQFPFREADDTALISLREDLKTTEAQCLGNSKNLLFFSEELEAIPPSLDSSVGGWKVTGCNGDACLDVQSGVALLNDDDVQLLAPRSIGRATWIRLVDREDLIAPGASDATPPTIELSNRVPATLYQTVTLRAGQRYILSWWDMARATAGGPFGIAGSAPSYGASVATSSWEAIVGLAFEPAHGDEDGEVWSERRSISFVAPHDGDYQVGFGIADASAIGASVAIANVQLEEARGEATFPSAYEATGAKRLVYSGECPPDNPEGFRKRFDYRCGTDGCFYDLRDPLIVDTELLNLGRSSLVGKVAVNNYNYRHTGEALNLVGTGILDCAADPRTSCYSSGYVEYDLTHYAFNVPMTDYSNDVRCFNFGAGSVRSGKALATERVLSLPLSSSDRDLVSQPAFLKTELSGRPLSGVYKLRIRDQPALIWNNLEDVQLIVNYRYWSRVERGPGG